MKVEITFDTSVPSDRQALESIFTEEELEEAAELSEITAGGSAFADASISSTEEEDDDEEVEELPYRIDWGESPIFLWKQSTGEPTNAGKVIQFLRENPWSTAREISEEFGWDMEYTNSVLTSSTPSRAFLGKKPEHREVPSGGYVWDIHPQVKSRLD